MSTDDSTTTTTTDTRAEALTSKLDQMNIATTFTIWPPSQRTRDAVTNRLIETLTTPSVLSKRYGVLPLDAATSAAHSIESAAFSAASSSASSSTSTTVDEGIEILQVYSKEISKLMIDAVKSRSSSTTATPPPSDVTPAPESETADEVSSSVVDNENENESS